MTSPLPGEKYVDNGSQIIRSSCPADDRTEHDGILSADVDGNKTLEGDSSQKLEMQHHTIHIDSKLTAITRASLQLSDNSYSFDSRDHESCKSSRDVMYELEQAPTGWKDQYETLFSLLKRGLLGYGMTETAKSTRLQNKQGQNNVSALLMGPRGQGKSFILERCLSDLSELAKRRAEQQKQHDENNQDLAAFRVVRVNGLVFAGDNATACAREIARQIGGMVGSKTAQRSPKKKPKLDDGYSKKSQPEDNNNSLDREHNLATRRSGIISNLALLDEALRTARIDNIPILIILEELDNFIAKGRMINKSSEDRENESNDRQLLLYHLLDRVADHKFLVSLVGLTTDLSTTTKFEKRVLSRAEGTSKFIYFGRMMEYEDFVEGVIMAFHCPFDWKEQCDITAMNALRKNVEYILRGGDDYKEDNYDDYSLVRRVLEHNYGVRGMDMRWCCRVVDMALNLLASDIEEYKLSRMQNVGHHVKVKNVPTEPKMTLAPRHFAIALNTLGAKICDIVQAKRPGIPSSHSLLLDQWERLLDFPYRGHDPRIRALFDLSGPQVAILLAARRILARDDTRSTVELDVDVARRNGAQQRSVLSMVAPLTYHRIHDEYTTSFVASGRYTISSDRYPSHLLYRALADLIELDLIRLKKDHAKGGPLQFAHCGALSTGANLLNLPLLINLNMTDELVGLLKAGALSCSTALREWGLKIN